MKIGILGCRGIPNHYGGFEQFAMHLATGLMQKGHTVTVYNSHNHPYKEKEWKGIPLRHRFDPEYLMGTAGQFVYDLLCILDSRSQGFDIILQLGYTSSALWFPLHPGGPQIITCMDGLEWKRSKYNFLTRKFLRWSERQAVNQSHALVADSGAIGRYIGEKYKMQPEYIAYGAEIFTRPDPLVVRLRGLEPWRYGLVIARMQPDNHTEEIIQGFLEGRTDFPLVLAGNHHNAFGRRLFRKYSNEKVIFLGAEFDPVVLNNLRYHCQVYFHGHSAGGTNPSLLEAMAASAPVVAHDNPFNREVLNDNAFYFTSPSDIAHILSHGNVAERMKDKIYSNRQWIREFYTWEKVVASYEQLFLDRLSSTVDSG